MSQISNQIQNSTFKPSAQPAQAAGQTAVVSPGDNKGCTPELPPIFPTGGKDEDIPQCGIKHFFIGLATAGAMELLHALL